MTFSLFRWFSLLEMLRHEIKEYYLLKPVVKVGIRLRVGDIVHQEHHITASKIGMQILELMDCPSTSHIRSDIDTLFRIRSCFSKKSTPIVCLYTGVKPSVLKAAIIDDLPTLPSPRIQSEHCSFTVSYWRGGRNRQAVGAVAMEVTILQVAPYSKMKRRKLFVVFCFNSRIKNYFFFYIHTLSEQQQPVCQVPLFHFETLLWTSVLLAAAVSPSSAAKKYYLFSHKSQTAVNVCFVVE